MENTTQPPYTNTPTSPHPTSSPSSSTSSNSTIKPLPALPPPDTAEEPYRDEPDTPVTHHHSRGVSLSIQSQPPQQIQLAYRPYTDLPSPSEAPSPTNDDDVPLAQLLLTPRQQQAPPYPYPPSQSPPYSYSQQPLSQQAPPYPYQHPNAYPLDAPPSYSVAVRQSYHSTLIQYIPSARPSSTLLIDIDEERGVDGESPDEVRHAVEKVVAMFVVATLLLVIAGVLGWLALGSGIWD